MDDVPDKTEDIELGSCLVIGGGGFLGSHIVQQLVNKAQKVTVFGRSEYPQLKAQGLNCLRGDIVNQGEIIAACRGMDTVFHTASLSYMWGRRDLIYQVNVEGCANVIKACRENCVRRLVYTSSPSVVIGDESIINGDESLSYPKQYNADYPHSKSLAEQLVLAANNKLENKPQACPEPLLTCAIRPHLILGPGDPHILPRVRRAAEKRRLRQIGDGRNQITITQVDNAAHAHILAAQELAGQKRCAGKAYFVGDSEPIYLWPWLNELLALWGLPQVTKRVSWGLSRSLALLSEALHHFMPWLGEPFMTTFVVDQLARSHSFSHQAASRDFGYQPIVSPEEALQKLAQWK
ncbi:MAG: NAD-dependent epimerase/dehydratase family protein [Oligosphaeraceae bacterium]|nr:NAD-dependent epimerase/dehydratase family protein [Oligosphaeraceae bacterium]